MRETVVGARIRERRKQIGITQADLAKRIGISASYLNLIESNKRRIAGPLLVRTAEALGASLEELDGAAERRLLETLTEIAEFPHLQAHGVERREIGALVGRFPGWARAMAALARSEREAVNTARTLSDRLAHDPFFAETVHRMLTRISAVRSASEILTEYDDIPDERRTRFLSMIRDESSALSTVGEALAAYFDKFEEADRTLTPLDEVEALLEARGHFFEELEISTTSLSTDLDLSTLAERLQRARQLVETGLSEQIEEIISAAREIETEAGRNRARRILIEYAAGAVLMPMEAMVEVGTAVGFDLDRLAELFKVPADAVCRRLLALPQQSGLPRFGYFQANAAGTIIEMYGLRGLPVPRYTAACPLWVLYRAQQSPDQVIRQHVVFPTGGRFVFVARARNSGEQGFGQPRHYVTDMLVMSEADASSTVYAANASSAPEEVGPACRLCPRAACPHRIGDPFFEQ